MKDKRLGEMSETGLVLRKDYDYDGLNLKHFTSLTQQESEMILEWRNDESVSRFMYQQHKTTLKQHQSFIDSLFHTQEKSYWGVFRGQEGLGVISLTRINILHSYSFLGIYVAPSQQHKGVGKQLLGALQYLSFKVLELHSLRLEVLEENQRAIAFYKRNGFIQEGLLREFALIGGEFKNIVLMGKINEES